MIENNTNNHPQRATSSIRTTATQSNKPSRISWQIDHNNDYRLVIIITQDCAYLEFLSENNANPQFFEKIFDDLKIILNDIEIKFNSKTSDGRPKKPFSSNTYFYEQKISKPIFPLEINIYIKKNLAASIILKDKSTLLKKEVLYRACVSDTRLVCFENYPPKKMLIWPTSSSFKTDLHTHFDAVLPTKTLTSLALRENVHFVIKNLNDALDAKLSYTHDDEKISINSLKHDFSDIYNKFEKGLEIPSGIVTSFSELEKIYKLRGLITDNKTLFSKILEKTAEYYHSLKIEYVELSMHDIIEQDWLKIALEVLPKIEEKYHVKIRFLAAIYNYFSSTQTISDIDTIKKLSSCPYIVGIDFAGHEQYKFSDGNIRFMEKICKWAEKNSPDFIIRIHAGENNLYPDNVLNALLLAKKYNIRLRIGHGVYGLNKNSLEILKNLARLNKIIIELNPDSNIALGTIKSFHQVPIKELYDNNIPIVIGTDGPGIYKTTTEQLITSLLRLGSTNDIFQFISETEMNHIFIQEKIFQNKMRQWQKTSFDKILRTLGSKIDTTQTSKPITTKDAFDLRENDNASQKTTTLSNIPPLTSLRSIKKKPIYIMSNALLKSANIEKKHLDNLIELQHALIKNLDPRECYFLVNHPQSEVNYLLSKLIESHNRQSNSTESGFDLVYAIPNISFSKKHATPLPSPLEIVSETFTDFPEKIIRKIEIERGILILVGGDAITHDAHLLLANSSTTYILMSESSEAVKYHIKSGQRNIQLNGIAHLIDYIVENRPDILRKNNNIHPETLRALQPNKLIIEFWSYYFIHNYKTLTQNRDKNLWTLSELAVEPMERMLLHMRHASMSIEFEISFVNLLHRYAEWHHHKSHYSRAVELLKKAKKMCKNLRKDEKCAELIANIYSSLGKSLTYHSENTFALKYLEKAYQKMNSLYGKTDPAKTLNVLGEIAVWYKINNHIDKARAIFEKLCEHPHLPKHDWQEAEYNRNLGECFGILKRDDKQHHYKITRRIYGDHPQIHNIFGFLHSPKASIWYMLGLSEASYYLDLYLQQPDYEYNPDFPAIHDAEAYYAVARGYKELGIWSKAKSTLNNCLRVIDKERLEIQYHPSFHNFESDCNEINENFYRKLRVLLFPYLKKAKIMPDNTWTIDCIFNDFSIAINFKKYLQNLKQQYKLSYKDEHEILYYEKKYIIQLKLQECVEIEMKTPKDDWNFFIFVKYKSQNLQIFFRDIENAREIMTHFNNARYPQTLFSVDHIYILIPTGEYHQLLKHLKPFLYDGLDGVLRKKFWQSPSGLTLEGIQSLEKIKSSFGFEPDFTLGKNTFDIAMENASYNFGHEHTKLTPIVAKYIIDSLDLQRFIHINHIIDLINSSEEGLEILKVAYAEAFNINIIIINNDNSAPERVQSINAIHTVYLYRIRQFYCHLQGHPNLELVHYIQNFNFPTSLSLQQLLKKYLERFNKHKADVFDKINTPLVMTKSDQHNELQQDDSVQRAPSAKMNACKISQHSFIGKTWKMFSECCPILARDLSLSKDFNKTRDEEETSESNYIWKKNV